MANCKVFLQGGHPPLSATLLKMLYEASHESVSFIYDAKTKLHALIAVHSTALGPALGGCRIFRYRELGSALGDALRLSQGMTYKNALAGLDFGGAKACIIEKFDPNDREEVLRLFAEQVHALNGKYITAEDMGTTVEDVMIMRKATPYVACFDQAMGGGGDPSPWTALGVFEAIRSAVEFRYGSSDLTKRRITIEGVGKVGYCLTKLLVEAGCEVLVSDYDNTAIERVRSEFGVQAASLADVYDQPCDIFSPNAVGQTINPQTLSRLKCDIIAGAANNQLSDTTVYSTILEKNIIYCPDFAANAGGVICAAGECQKSGWDESWVKERVIAIGKTISRILKMAEEESKSTEVIALELARQRLTKSPASSTNFSLTSTAMSNVAGSN